MSLLPYLGAAGTLGALAILSGLRVDRALGVSGGYGLARVANGLWRMGLLAMLLVGLAFPPVQLGPIVFVAIADVVSPSPQAFVSLSAWFSGTRDTSNGEQQALALESEARRLQETRRYEAATATWSRLVERFRGRDDPWARRAVARALLGQAYASAQLGRSADELATLGRVLAEYSNDPSPSVAVVVDTAMFNRAAALVRGFRLNEADELFDMLARRLQARSQGVADDLIAETMIQRAKIAQSRGDLDLEIAIARDLLTHFQESTVATMQIQVSAALLALGNALTLKGELDGALEAYREVEIRFGQAEERALWPNVADALIEAATLHAQTGRAEQAIAECDLLIRRFPELEPYVEQARLLKRALDAA